MNKIELTIDAANASVYMTQNGQPVARFTDHKKAAAFALSLIGL